LETLRFYHNRSVIRNDIDPKEATVDFGGQIVVGNFIDRERPTFLDNYQAACRSQLAAWPERGRAGAVTKHQEEQ